MPIRRGAPLWLHKLPTSGRIGFAMLVILGLVCLFGPLLVQDPYAQNIGSTLRGPTPAHWLGTDQLGRDLLARLVHGARLSLLIGVGATLIGLLVGGVIGALSGYFGGWFDILVTRVMDMLVVFPGILVAMIVVTVAGDGLFNVILAVGLRAVPVFARLVHTSTLTIREREYITAARAAGASGLRILWSHVLPALMNGLIVLAALEIANCILVGATLSFLGIGISAETPEWGAMLNAGRRYIFQQGQLVIFPGLAIMLSVLSINLFADGMRTALDVRRTRGTLLE